MSPSWHQDRAVASLFWAASGSALAVPDPATGNATGTGTQRKSHPLLTILLIAPLALAAASGANATDIGPGLVTGPVEVDSSNSPVNVVGFTAISSTGNGINAPSNAGPGVTLNINTESAPNGVISITSGGLGVNSNFPSSHATINITSGPSGPVRILSGGAALSILGGSSLTANANGGNLVFHSTAAAFGVVAQFGATIDMTGPATIISDGGAAAVLIGGSLTNLGSIANLTNVDILANGASIGLDATRMGTVATMTGGSITILGDGLAGLYSDTNGVTNANNVKITTTGANTYGAFAEATIVPPGVGVTSGGGTIHIAGGSITTGGTGAFGVFAQGQPSIPSTITLNNSAITTTGDGAVGYRADGGAISATNTTTQTSGASAPGGMLSNGGTVTINGGSVTTTGAGSFGFLVQPFTPVLGLNADPTLPGVLLSPEPTLPNVLQISNATVNSAADAFHVVGAIANIAVNGSSVMTSNGVLLNTLSSGTATLTATTSQLTGAIATDSSSTSDLTLQGNSTWTMTGSSNLTNLVNDPSIIIFTPPTGDPTQFASYKTLTVANYASMGGTIAMNTFLGGDGSPSDRLVVNGGSAIGNSVLRITNTGGPGSETLANGITVVQALNGGTTAPGAFGLVGELRAGAFDYDLLRGGLNGSNSNDWFLRSAIVVQPVPPVVTPPVVTPPVVPPVVTPPVVPGPLPPIPPFPTDPPPQPLPPGVFPIIGPELATDGVVQPIARQMALTMLGTLHERIGDTLTIENAGADAEGWGRSGWARFFGQQIDNHYQAFGDPSTTGRLFGVQAGFDIWRGSFFPGHRDAAGLYFAYGNTALDVNGLVTNADATAFVQSRAGKVNLYAYSGGAYWTHYGPSAWYLDAVVQGTAYTGNATTQFANLPTTGSGIITSLETGYPIPLPLGPRFVLEPQGQILWQHTSFSEANDGLGPVALGTTSGVTGRIGVRAQSTINTDHGQVWQPYVRANLWQNWGGEATTTFGADAVPLLEQSTQLEFAAGVTVKVTPLLSFYAQAGYMFAIGDTDGGRRQGVMGDIGLRLTFGQPPPPPPPAVVPVAAVARSYLVFFDWDKATLTDRARQIIREAADNSTKVQYTRIEVNGHTDTSGTARYNQGLSVRRAQAVAAELVRDGVSAAAISIRGFGETNLLVPTGPGVREPQNRRVEIIIR